MLAVAASPITRPTFAPCAWHRGQPYTSGRGRCWFGQTKWAPLGLTLSVTVMRARRWRQGAVACRCKPQPEDRQVGEPASVELLQWLERLGARGLEGICVSACPGDRYGVFARKPFAEGGEIFAIPYSACLGLGGELSQAKDQDTMGMPLARELLSELHSKDSAYGPHLALLGPDCVSNQHPLLWARSKTRQDVMLALGSLAKCSPAASHYLQNSSNIGDAVETLGDDLALGPGPVSVRLAMAVVSSRAFTIDGRMVLCPLLDLLNHWTRPGPAPCGYAIQEGFVLMLADRDILSGEELLHSYGQYSNLELHSYYGFVPKTNSCDFVDVQLDPVVLSQELPAGWNDPSHIQVEACDAALRQARSSALRCHGWDQLDEPLSLRLPLEAEVSGRIAPVFRLLALETEEQIEAAEGSLFWMDSLGSLPAETSRKLEERARILESRWLQGVISQYKTCITALQSLGSPEAGAIVEVLVGEMGLIDKEFQRVKAFCETARLTNSEALEEWWGDTSGWLGEWSGWTGGRFPVGVSDEKIPSTKEQN